MSIIHKSKDGRLHIYVRQDMYKGKLKSENWVGRTFIDKKQKVFSSGTKNLDEAKVILEKWYDDLVSGALEAKNQENDHISEKTTETTSTENIPLEKAPAEPVIEAVSKPEVETGINTNLEGQPKTSIIEKVKNIKFDLSFLKKTDSKDGQNKLGILEYREAIQGLRLVEELINKNPKEFAVIQLGASSGKEICYLAKIFPETSFIYTDIFESVTSYASSKLKLPNIDYVTCPSEGLPGGLRDGRVKAFLMTWRVRPHRRVKGF